MKEKHCVFPGSFNPFTLGHRHLVEKASERFDSVTVAVAAETYKDDMIPPEVRSEIARKSLADLPNVDVRCFDGMLTDFLRELGCFNVVRGYRNDGDYEYEKELERVYVSMDRRIDFVLLRSELCDISSEKVRAAVKNGEKINGLVSDAVVGDVIGLYDKK